MFSVEWKKTENQWENDGRKGDIQYKADDKLFVCKIETWAFASCACFALHSFKNAYNFRFTPENVDEFFKFVCTLDKDWQPKEFYFMLSKSQLGVDRIKCLYKHPNVRLRDVFDNKSHGPNKVYLFRYSASKDFKPVRKLRGMA